MNTEAYGTTVFCDDIRFETNGKLTLVGCYSDVMTFSGPAPGVLSKFAALVNLRIPRNVEITKVKLCALMEVGGNSEEIFGAEVEFTEEQRQAAFEKVEGVKPEDRVLGMTFPLNWTALEVKDEGYIRVRAFLDDNIEVKLGSLKVNFTTGEQITDDSTAAS